MIKPLFFTLLSLVLFSFTVSPVQARDIFDFPSCPNPGGTQIAGYASGLHQIVGGGLLSGSDYVYRVGDNIFVQCFCSEDKTKGIQTNWLHEIHVSPSQEQGLLTKGWLKIENGSDWGLPPGTYFAKNIPFDCKNGNCLPTARKITIKQTNISNIQNFIDVRVNTGGNTIEKTVGGTENIITGTATVNITVENQTGANIVQ